MVFSVKDYTIAKFERSPLRDKKYRVYIIRKDGSSGEAASRFSNIFFDFGQIGYEHFKDSTPLKLYSKDDHNDQKRRELYRSRFRHLYDPEVYSPTYFSWNYLW